MSPRPSARRWIDRRTASALVGALLVAAPADAQGPPSDFGWRPAVELTFGEPLTLGVGLPVTLERIKSNQGDPPRDRVALRLVAATFDLLGPIGIRRPATTVNAPLELAPPGVFRTTGTSMGVLGVGAEYLMQLAPTTPSDAGAWAYVRVLDVDTDGVVAEIAVAPPGASRLVRDPIRVDAGDARDGTRLEWQPGDASVVGDDTEVSVAVPRSYEVRRRAFGDAEFESLAVVRGTSFIDADTAGREAVAFEYAVVRVDANGAPAPGVMGSSASLIVGAEESDVAITVGPGSRVDLLRGALTASLDEAHVEFGRASPGSVAVLPKGETRLVSPKTGKSGTTDPSWWLPPPSHRTFLAGRTVVLRDGVEAVFALPNGLVGRLVVEDLGEGRWLVRRRMAAVGSRLLPRAPDQSPTYQVEADGAWLRAETVSKLSGVDPRSVVLVFEREVPFASEVWSPFAVLDQGLVRADARGLFDRDLATTGDSGRAPITRVRLRFRTSTGVDSPPGEPSVFLASRGAEALAAALADIETSDFQRRVESRAVLRQIGEPARAALEAIILAEPGTRAEAAREVLASIERGEAGEARLLAELTALALENAQAAGLGGPDPASWLGPCPPGLVDADPARRMHTLLLLVDRAERGAVAGGPRDAAADVARARPWVRAVAAVDRDEGVRTLATFVLDVGARPQTGALIPTRSAWLEPTAARFADEPLDLRWSDLPAGGIELAWAIEARPELSDLELGEPLARLLATLRDPATFLDPAALGGAGGADLSESSEARFFDYDARTAELVLRLAERSRRPGATAIQRRAWLAAASALLPGEALMLEAWREVTDRRIGAPTEEPAAARSGDRLVITLESADLERLEETLAGLGERRGRDSRGVDIRLPAGTYGVRQSVARFIEVPLSHVRLLPADPSSEVILHAGVRVTGRVNVVLEGLTLRSAAGQAITALDGAHVVALRSRLEGAGTVVHAQASTLEMIECEIVAFDPAQPPSTAVRLILGSRLRARASLFDAGTVFVSSDGEAWLDRCVLDSGIRTLVQSQEGGRLVARESLLRGEAMGLFRVTEGVLAAVVLDAARDPLGQVKRSEGAGGLRVSPRLFRLVQPGQTVPPSMRLAREPLSGR